MKLIQINEYLKLHDGEKIIYCKHSPEYPGNYEYVCKEVIPYKKHDVVLIVAGSDCCMYNQHLDILPKNVKKAFFSNCHIDKDLWGDIIVPIPLGIEISETINKGAYSYCQGFPEGAEKKSTLSTFPTGEPSKFIYANFRLWTNFFHRNQVKQMALIQPHITWCAPHGSSEETSDNPRPVDSERFAAGIPYSKYVEEILDHEAVLCPQGNDSGDNLRIYESLYLSRVPLTFNAKMHENLHHMFPTVLIENLSELFCENKNDLQKRINDAKKKMKHSHGNGKYLDFNYWQDMILREANKI